MKIIKKRGVLLQPLGDNLGFSNLSSLYSEKNVKFHISFLNHSRTKEISNINKKVKKSIPIHKRVLYYKSFLGN